MGLEPHRAWKSGRGLGIAMGVLGGVTVVVLIAWLIYLGPIKGSGIGGAMHGMLLYVGSLLVLACGGLAMLVYLVTWAIARRVARRRAAEGAGSGAR
jgi:hypothetical protein